MGEQSATIYDVARAAGVSTKTVSRVLNGEGPVRRETRDGIERAMRELGYVPSSAARSLRSRHTALVGVVSGAISLASEAPELAGLPEVYLLRGIQDVLDASARTMLLADVGRDPSGAARIARTFAEHQVGGVVHVAPFHREVALERVGPAPVVIANGYDAAGTPAVLPDDRAGQRALVDGLIERGHRRIAYLQLQPELEASRLRTMAYRDALEAAGLPFDPDLVRPADLPDDATTERRTAARKAALDAVLDRPDPPTAILCGNDRMAIGIYGMLRARGLRIPEDVSVAGYDDYRLISETLYPQLATVELPYREIGRRAAALLLDPHPPTSPILIGGEVRWRASVAPPNVRGTARGGPR